MAKRKLPAALRRFTFKKGGRRRGKAGKTGGKGKK